MVDVSDVDVDEPETMTPSNVIDLRLAIEAQNAEMINKMKLIGKAPTPLLLIQNELQVLIDFMFSGNEDAINAYETACHMRLNHQLRAQLERWTERLTVPSDGS